MIFISKTMILISIIYLIKVFLYPYYRPVNKKNKKRNRIHQKRISKQQKVDKWKLIKRKVATRYIRKYLSEIEYKRLKNTLACLDKDVLPEEIRLEQILYVLLSCFISFMLFQFNEIFGYVSLIFIVFGWLYPTDEIDKQIQYKNKQIANDFPAFYSMVYYQYSKTINIFFADVIRDYLPNANTEMAKELGYMLDNIDYGEAFVLKEFKKRVPLHYIIKFCDIMETRLKGYDNVSQMSYLKNELDEFRVRALEDELEKRTKANEKIQMVLIVVLVIYIFIYYIFIITESMKMFS